MSLNKCIMMGRIGKQPELRRTQSGTAVTSFSLAVDRDFGEKETDWIDVVAWKQTAELVCQYMGKGRVAVVEGRLQVREWTDQNNNKRRSTEVVADRVYFGDSKREATSNTYSDNEPVAAPGYSVIEDDGELPF